MGGAIPEPRCTAYRYSLEHGLPCDIDSMALLGLTAARLARWYGLEEYKVPEGPYRVHAWPAGIWDEAVRCEQESRAR